MSEDVSPFSRLRAAKPRGGALSFDALSASIADAQESTGFVDTKAQARSDDAKPPRSERASGIGESENAIESESANGEHVTIAPNIGRTANAAESGSPGQVSSVNQKAREPPSAVQCNMRLPHDIRDALHLQALRERRTIADMVSEVMREYLDARGTFERLR